MQHFCFLGEERTSGTAKAPMAAMAKATLSHWMWSLPCLNSAVATRAGARPAATRRSAGTASAAPARHTRPDSDAAAAAAEAARGAPRHAARDTRPAAARGRRADAAKPGARAVTPEHATGVAMRLQALRCCYSAAPLCARVAAAASKMCALSHARRIASPRSRVARALAPPPSKLAAAAMLQLRVATRRIRTQARCEGAAAARPARGAAASPDHLLHRALRTKLQAPRARTAARPRLTAHVCTLL